MILKPRSLFMKGYTGSKVSCQSKLFEKLLLMQMKIGRYFKLYEWPQKKKLFSVSLLKGTEVRILVHMKTA